MYISSCFTILYYIQKSYEVYKREFPLIKNSNKKLLLEKKYQTFFYLKKFYYIFLYNWPSSIKLFMMFSFLFVIIGNFFLIKTSIITFFIGNLLLYKCWRLKNKKEIILPIEKMDKKGTN